MASIDGARVAFLVATEGVEQVELTQPWADVKGAGGEPTLLSTETGEVQGAGGEPTLLSTETGEVQGFDHLDKADTFEVDHAVGEVSVADYDALVLPGGVANPDQLRMHEGAVAFVRDFVASGKPVAAICHAPWSLVEAGSVAGRTLTSWPSLQTDIRNAGGTWVDQEVVVDESGPGPLITSRNPGDLEAFGRETIAHLEKARG